MERKEWMFPAPNLLNSRMLTMNKDSDSAKAPIAILPQPLATD